MSHAAQGQSAEHPLRFRVDLARCLTPSGFVHTLREEFAMPAGCESVAQVDDWMRDLGWFDARFIAIEVHNFAVAQRRKPQDLHWVLQRLALYQAHFARSGAKELSVVTWNNAGFAAVALPSPD